MIVVLFGQPHSGKSTLAKELRGYFDSYTTEYIDGDQLREIFQNKDFSKEGRLKNLQKASDIAAYLDWNNKDVIISVVYPYKEARDYLNNLVPDVKWIYLHYTGERGRENFHVKDFESPEESTVLQLDTSEHSKKTCLDLILKYIGAE